jgi:hypothetical protein
MMEKSMPVFYDEPTDFRSEVEKITASIVSNDDLSGQPLTQRFHQKSMISEDTDLA